MGLYYKYKKLGISIVLLMLVTLLLKEIINCSGSIPSLDDNRTNIALDEAQSLVPFKICFPTYLPSGIDSVPAISYYADFGDSPEKDVVIRYKRINNQKAFEIWQRYDPREISLDEDNTDNRHEGYKYGLIMWVLGNGSLTNNAQDISQVDVNLFQEGQNEWWWLYETNKPVKFATMTRWIQDDISYKIYSYLSVEEIKKVTKSMFYCSKNK